MDRLRLLGLLGTVALMLAAPLGAGEGTMLRLTMRSREAAGDGFRVRATRVAWKAAETAVIVCDMWDRHWCRSANARGAELAPRMNAFLTEARRRGALIIHAPSGCMEAYEGRPERRRAREAPAAAGPPAEIAKWCYRIPAEERGEYPLDQSDGGCDDEPKCATGNPWRAQMAALEIRPEDAISDSGLEIWNLLEQRGIRNVMVLGVHLNMCVLGRPFGLRNMARYGKNTVLVRDLTDTMYNPRAKPFVSHFRGTELMVEHVEKWVCPTITSAALLGGRPFRFAGDAGR